MLLLTQSSSFSAQLQYINLITSTFFSKIMPNYWWFGAISNLQQIRHNNFLELLFFYLLSKNLYNFVSLRWKLDNRCYHNQKGINCTDAYSFYHRIPIGNHDEKEFEKLVKEVPLVKLTTCFHEFSEYESTNFLFWFSQML